MIPNALRVREACVISYPTPAEANALPAALNLWIIPVTLDTLDTLAHFSSL
jgi:hypothetical protein